MIYINKDSTNPTVLTLTEKSSLLSPFFLFEFINDTQKNTVLFSAADLSSYKSRYNRFDIIEASLESQNLTGGTVNLTPSGFWTYNVYEASALTLSVSATTGQILETGKVYVDGIDTAVASIYR